VTLHSWCSEGSQLAVRWAAELGNGSLSVEPQRIVADGSGGGGLQPRSFDCVHKRLRQPPANLGVSMHSLK